MSTLRLSVLFLDAWRETLREFARPLARLFGRSCPASLRLDFDALPDERLRDLGLLDGRGPSLRRPENEPASAFNAPARSMSPNGPSTGAGWRFRR